MGLTVNRVPKRIHCAAIVGKPQGHTKLAVASLPELQTANLQLRTQNLHVARIFGDGSELGGHEAQVFLYGFAKTLSSAEAAGRGD